MSKLSYKGDLIIAFNIWINSSIIIRKVAIKLMGLTIVSLCSFILLTIAWILLSDYMNKRREDIKQLRGGLRAHMLKQNHAMLYIVYTK
jgi:hypothetical protein